MDYIRWHEAEDSDKVAELVASMRENGWIGSPLVCWDDQLYTGMHRSTAAEIVGIEFPTISIIDIFEEAGLDFWESWEFNGEPTSESAGMTDILLELPSDIREKYGIDAH